MVSLKKKHSQDLKEGRFVFKNADFNFNYSVCRALWSCRRRWRRDSKGKMTLLQHHLYANDITQPLF